MATASASESAPRYALGLDIGGTFTDIVVYDRASGRQLSSKVLTTHDDPARAVITGTRALVESHRLDPKRFERVIHATTLFTNALIERKGARTGLITTRGFRDTLEIGRERKYDLYDIAIENPAPLVPRNLRLEVRERILADGSVHEPLDERELMAAVDQLIAADVTSIAVVFLHAYANDVHEQAAARIIARRAPRLSVTTSSEVVREIREYERASTTVANAYIKPLAVTYIDRMQRELAKLGIEAPLLLMLSNGGLTHVEEAKRVPVQMLESGPAAGALVAGYYGGALGEPRLLAFDMGGTTAKLSLVDDGEPLIAYAFEAARQKRFLEGSGLPIRISTVELIEIGAGGGSIARRDEIGLLKVGPDSAGSEPGPAAYGLGGTNATVTDANLALGVLHPATFAGGTMSIDMSASAAALNRLAGELLLPSEAVAAGIQDIVNENMAAAARVHIAERGRDPREYALLCTGGGGPVHAYEVARKLGVGRIICPPSPGVASALGLIIAPARMDRVRTIGFRLDRDDLSDLERAFRDLEADALQLVKGTGIDVERADVRRLADGRFIGQGFDLVVRLPGGPYDIGDGAAQREQLKNAFEGSYRQKFSRTPPSVAIEFITIRIAVTVPIDATCAPHPNSVTQGKAQKGQRRVYFTEARGFLDAAVYERLLLAPGTKASGPAVIEEASSTLVVGPGATFEVEAGGSIIVTLAGVADA